jgi:hypothetical protein
MVLDLDQIQRKRPALVAPAGGWRMLMLFRKALHDHDVGPESQAAASALNVIARALQGTFLISCCRKETPGTLQRFDLGQSVAQQMASNFSPATTGRTHKCTSTF